MAVGQIILHEISATSTTITPATDVTLKVLSVLVSTSMSNGCWRIQNATTSKNVALNKRSGTGGSGIYASETSSGAMSPNWFLGLNEATGGGILYLECDYTFSSNFSALVAVQVVAE